MKRWRTGGHIERRIGSGLLVAERQFSKVIGHCHIPVLLSSMADAAVKKPIAALANVAYYENRESLTFNGEGGKLRVSGVAVRAQETRATVWGIITDPQGATVPAAKCNNRALRGIQTRRALAALATVAALACGAASAAVEAIQLMNPRALKNQPGPVTAAELRSHLKDPPAEYRSMPLRV